MGRTLSLLCLAPLLGACALTEAQCRDADWFALGERDALVYATPPQIDQYTEQCSRYGVRVTEEPYMTGWRDGNLELRRRLSQTGGGPD